MRRFSLALPDRLISPAIFLAAVAFNWWLHFSIPNRISALAFGLPMLLCLWRPDRKLLVAMVLAFVGISGLKIHHLVLGGDLTPALGVEEWVFRQVNLLAIALAVDVAGRSMLALRGRNEALRAANAEIESREEEIASQNEELRQQTEELEAQAEELRAAAAEAENREAMLSKVLTALAASGRDESALLQRMSDTLLELAGSGTCAASVLTRDGQELVVAAVSGASGAALRRMPFDGSFCELILSQGRTGFIEDLRKRPDLRIPPILGKRILSILAAPIFLAKEQAGVVEIFSEEPRAWSERDFEAAEWMAAQAGLVLTIRRLRAEMENENARLAERVEKQTGELKAMVGDLEHFSYSIVHDLRAPLRAMHGYASLLHDRAERFGEGERKDFLSRIVQSAARLDRLLVDGLRYSRAGSGPLEGRVIEPTLFIRALIASYPDLSRFSESIVVADTMPAVLANEAGFTQCVSNLVGNAVKFVQPGCPPQVKVWAAARDGRVRLYFEDRGIGVPPEMRERVFDMFQRAAPQYEGTGIGLALVRKMAVRMGGRVGLEAPADGGSRFWVELPAAEERS